MKRRVALKSMALGAIGLSTGLLFKSKHSVPSGYTYFGRMQLKDKSFTVYVKKSLQKVVILERETFEPYWSIKPVVVQHRIAIDDAGQNKIEGTVISRGQHVPCVHADDKGIAGSAPVKIIVT